jgi:hypothetical protein
LWVELAGLYLALNQATESASCWLNALWERDEPPQEWLWGWLRAEAKLSRWSPGQGPPESARALAAYITWAIHEENEQAILRARAPSLIRALDDVEPHLPVRAVWLARMALAQVVGGDPLGLARCRDRLLERLYTAGPALDRDLPGFLRFAGPGGERYTAVRDWLLKARDLVQRFVTRQPPRPGEATMGPNSLPTTVLQRVGLECEDGTFTRAYASLTLAWALARLGENQAAVQLTGQARAVLHNGDPVHELLLAAYEARIGQAGQGRRPAPFPAAWQARLADLPPLSRYLVDRLRTASRILEPEERLNPYRAAVFARHRELSDLELAIVALASDDAEEMTKRVPVLLAVDAPPDVRGEILAAILDVAGRLPESIVGQVLQQTLTVIDGHPPSAVRERLSLTVRGLTLAMRLGRADVARQLADRAIRTLSGKPTPTSLSAAEPLAILAARLANREAFRSEGRRLLTQVRAWIWAETEGSSRLRRSYGAYTRLAVQVLLPGSASSALGTEDTALDLAREMLFSGRLSSRGEQAEMARAYASALGHAPIGLALGRIEEIFQRLEVVPTQMASSNSHYNLAALGVVEAVTRAVVDEDFTLGPEVRRWLDDDEYALRQRIDRDMRTLLGGASSV